MYRIMEVKKRGTTNFDTLYQFRTEIDTSGEKKYVEKESLVELDTYVEDLLNNKGYSKDDFIIVTVKEYTINANIN